ncbi:hypothetical protein JCM10908_005062 [Rhodotorula pacifica]|uniref:uncharacterized protein n=1 Tax=Rhodotorula pacifica TaxID=1495444 RepID=UPI00317422EE
MLTRTSMLSARLARRTNLATLGRATYATDPYAHDRPLANDKDRKDAEWRQKNMLVVGGTIVAGLGAYYFMKEDPEARKEYEHIKEGVKRNPGPTR